ncbi:MAG TPA: hypothetical protein VGG53_09845 [Mycobacterium sp.]|jgi:hypothetical protein|uniref:CDGP domain-containing protein n=1 Tax=Mycobacterium sp. TaxID=1785 RepID=UPI002F42759D
MTAAIGAALTAGGLIIAAPPASAGCLDPAWAGHPMAQMCDSAVDADGMWERCLTSYPNGAWNPAETDCYTMSANDPPRDADPIVATPPTHIDP